MAASTPAPRPGRSIPPGGERQLVVGRRFRAMGSTGHVIVVGPDAAALATAAVERIEALEAAWSRFRRTSDVSRINRGAPNPVVVGLDTITLVERALAGRRLTGRRFDPLLLGPLEALGYDRPFGSWADSCTAERSRPPADPLAARPDRLAASARSGLPAAAGRSIAERSRPPAVAPAGRLVGLRRGGPAGACPAEVVVDRRACTVSVPAGAGFDPGGIGKGLAADLVTAELMADGAVGAMVNLGGDLRVRGTGSRGSAWPVSIVDPDGGAPLVTLDLVDGAVATSSPVRRRWVGPDGPAHHLLDPRTGLPRPSGPRLTSVVAGDAWWAEVAATALCATAGTGDRAPGGESTATATTAPPTATADPAAGGESTATPGPAGEPGVVGGLDGIAVWSVADDGRVEMCPRFARYRRTPGPGSGAAGADTDG